MRWLLVVVAACGAPSNPDVIDAASDAASGTDGAVDGALGCPESLFRTFTLPQLSSHSNVCVDSATCTFTRTAGCAAHFSCDYALAGTQAGDVTFANEGSHFTATFTAAGRVHEWSYDTGMAYRIKGSFADQHICVFTDGNASPVFSRPQGDCPDVTRTYKLRQVAPQSCSTTLRCGVFQTADACTVDAFCTYPTGQTTTFHDLAIARAGSQGTIVGDATTDPMYPTRYELRLAGDFANGAGAATDAHLEYFFNAPATPTCSWMPNGAF